MASLTQVAITARKTIRYTVFFIIFLTVGRILLNVFVTVYLTIFPPAPPPPTIKWGKLTKINFPSSPSYPKLDFTLETATGSLPVIKASQAKVYFMPKPSPNLLALDTAKLKARQLGFNEQNPIQRSDTLYRFDANNYPSNLLINIVTGTFSISYDLNADRSAIANRPPAAELAATYFKNYLKSADTYPSDLTGPLVPNYFKLESGSLTRVLALSEADVTKVNLFRKEYDKLPSVTSSPNKANVWAILGGSRIQGQEIIAAEYHYYPVDETQFSTYPILTAEQAFSKLTEGKAYIANLGQYKNGGSLKIRSVYLAYYDPDVASDFFQPVWVFDSKENDPENSFVAYVPAVTPEYYSED